MGNHQITCNIQILPNSNSCSWEKHKNHSGKNHTYRTSELWHRNRGIERRGEEEKKNKKHRTRGSKQERVERERRKIVCEAIPFVFSACEISFSSILKWEIIGFGNPPSFVFPKAT
jgi:hypothetical protein